MSATAPTAQGNLHLAKTTYISWGDFDFELIANNVFRPALSVANEVEVNTNVKTYKSYTPKDTMEPMTIHVLYSPAIWDSLRSAKEAGTVNLLETSDGFSAQAMITEMAEVSADVSEPITDMPITFSFPTDGTGTN